MMVMLYGGGVSGLRAAQDMDIDEMMEWIHVGKSLWLALRGVEPEEMKEARKQVENKFWQAVEESRMRKAERDEALRKYRALYGEDAE